MWLKWRRATRVICDVKMSNKVKDKLYRTVVRPVMLHGNALEAHFHKMSVIKHKR